MTDEPHFLRAVLADPAADTPRLVYADWLDEQSDDPAAPAMAEFLRLSAGLPSDETDARLKVLAAGLEPDWLAVVSKLPVENCKGKRDEGRSRSGSLQLFRFDFLCDRRWEDMRPTDDATVRDCDGCGEGVHFCDSITVARQHARQGHCVAIDLGVIRRTGDLSPIHSLRSAGRPSPGEVDESAPDAVSVERDRRRAERA